MSQGPCLTSSFPGIMRLIPVICLRLLIHSLLSLPPESLTVMIGILYLFTFVSAGIPRRYDSQIGILYLFTFVSAGIPRRYDRHAVFVYFHFRRNPSPL
jgi:hypothetical protein